LFLDEIGDLSMALQGKLLRALEDGVITPVGATRDKRVSFRVLSATNVDLQSEIENGQFRQDLYFRLNGFSLWLPPLREHKEDLPLLAEYFLQRLATEMGMRPPELSPAAQTALGLTISRECARVEKPARTCPHRERRWGHLPRTPPICLSLRGGECSPIRSEREPVSGHQPPGSPKALSGRQ